ncbi:MAG: HAMP domain-containing histidine kinase [Treponema sp.]|jgi:two-component system sensor histidine kinase HydH|nr:HAMP domain-containing histidine kinase [Treponema sp.]
MKKRLSRSYGHKAVFSGNTGSLFAAILGWLLFSALAVFITWTIRDRARLLRDNENEQLFNTLFTELRSFEDFGSVIENNAVLKARISGFAVYGFHLNLLYSWGKTPASFDESILQNTLLQGLQGRFGRYTIPDKNGGSVKFIIRNGDGRGGEPLDQPLRISPFSPGPGTPIPGEGKEAEKARSPDESATGKRTPQERAEITIIRQGFPFFNTLARGRYYYVDISHPAYRRTMIITSALLILCIPALFAAAAAIRRLYLRSHTYREQIEAQKNLVVLGTAASTLAHEIKNPLSSIRLQTGILRKTLNGENQEELTIIEEEVNRLSDLTYRVNDYLREASGNPEALKVYDLLEETGRRLCRRDIMEEGAAEDVLIWADKERFRSVFENLLRNALEAGGPPEAVSAQIIRGSAGAVIITVNDRGQGIDGTDKQRVFDLFFTKKSAGTGIGLSIGKRFVEAAGGTIELDNREGGGVRAQITIKEYRK